MAQPPRAETALPSRERIVAAATELFARHGFHGVTTRQIAAAVELNVATVHHHVGGKRDLYEQVFLAMQEEENALVQELLEELEHASVHDPETLRRLFNGLVDRLADMLCANPARGRLYVRRWLEKPPPADSAGNEQNLLLFRSLYRVLETMRARGVIRPRADLGFLLRSVDWLAYGYFVGGPVGPVTWRDDPHREENLRAFKEYLHEYLACMLRF